VSCYAHRCAAETTLRRLQTLVFSIRARLFQINRAAR
jgi:hypothetical protein